MLDYLFLIPTSPNLEEGSLRRDLQRLCFQQVKKLDATFVVWLLGDAEVDHPHFKKIDCEGTSKEEKLKEAGDRLADMPRLAKYLVRLDDDDLINPEEFDRLAKANFDIAYDRKHFFYDLATNLASSQKREWIPNTAIMDFNHALTKVEAKGGAETEDDKNYLFACDHSRAWHPFFKGMRTIKEKEPIYVRILNPQSITAGGTGEFDENKYFRYLQGFGKWRAELPAALTDVKSELENIRQKHFGKPLNFKPKRGLFSRLK
ncbi:MAG TPA: hypothetical protein VJ949_14620 [Cryomorphaceae bacterium]|nr:hypothetical protein [Cryomorphaceae bacterium]